MTKFKFWKNSLGLLLVVLLLIVAINSYIRASLVAVDVDESSNLFMVVWFSMTFLYFAPIVFMAFTFITFELKKKWMIKIAKTIWITFSVIFIYQFVKNSMNFDFKLGLINYIFNLGIIFGWLVLSVLMHYVSKNVSSWNNINFTPTDKSTVISALIMLGIVLLGNCYLLYFSFIN